MKQKNKIYYIILLFATLIGVCVLPALVKKITYKPDSYPFVYYSCILNDLCLIDYSNKKTPMQDLKGNVYTTVQFDSLQPMLNFKQLMSDGRLPDSIKGVALDPKIVRAKSVNYRYNANEVSTPSIGLYVLFEAMPKRIGLEMPDDVFRFKDKIEFIDNNTNIVNKEKSELFRAAIEKEGYSYPTHGAWGNPNPRKPYDEGYFCLDNKGELFHMKMVNGRPYFRNTHVSDSIDVTYFSMLEVADKRFYGFVFSKSGDMYIIENDGGSYKTVKLDIEPVDLKHDQIILMGNMFDWTVSVITPQAKKCYGLDAESLKQIAKLNIERTPGKWDEVSKWLFPVYLTFDSKYSDYLAPAFHFTAFTAFIANFILALGRGVLERGSTKKRIFNIIYILITGLAGFVALLLLSRLRRNH